MKIEVSIKARAIHADSYEAAKEIAWLHMNADSHRQNLLVALGAAEENVFYRMARVEKECNGTYTVVIP